MQTNETFVVAKINELRLPQNPRNTKVRRRLLSEEREEVWKLKKKKNKYSDIRVAKTIFHTKETTKCRREVGNNFRHA